MKRLAALALFAIALAARGVSITGADWIVHFNLPDTNNFAVAADEFTLRDALVARISALQAGQRACLATYTWTGSNLTSGAAGPIVSAMQAALDRGVSLAMAVDGGVDLTLRAGGSNTLAGLAARPTNALQLVQDDSASGIMHDKVGLFEYGTSRWVIAGSWNFTQAACTFQWNAMVELRNDAACAAYSNEFVELLAGRFHDHTNKSHAHDGSTFRLAASWTNDFVRFAPYPSSAAGGSNALTDVTNAIGRASSQIVFAINQLTRLQVATSLVHACNRGVEVAGVLALSDATNTPYDFPVYQMLTNVSSYATTNTVHLFTAFTTALGTNRDDGYPDLIHAKWMAIDPFGARPVAIIGSANWTDAALSSDNSNDENLLFLHDGGIARALYAHFKRIVRTWNDRDDSRLVAIDAQQVAFRPTDTNRYLLQSAPYMEAVWTDVGTVMTGALSGIAMPAAATATGGVWRVRRAD